MTTLRETAEHPEMQALFAALSPAAQHTASRLIDHLDRMSLDDAERTLDLILGDASYEQTRREIAIEADRALAAHFRALSPDVQQLAVAVDQRARLSSDPAVQVLDDGQKTGIRVERFDWDETPSAWLEFSAGKSPDGVDSPLVMVDVNLDGGQPGLGLIVDGQEVCASSWTLGDLKQMHAALGRIIADPRLAGALAEQH